MKVFKWGRLIDGTGAGPQPGATVVIRDQRIEAVTTKPAAEWPQDAEIIDVSGMTILPGLIDCHDHMAMHGYDLARRWGLDEPHSTRTLRTAKVLEQTLAAGYTAVRDAAGLDAGFKRAIEEGLIRGPRLVLSLAIISPIGGLGDRTRQVDGGVQLHVQGSDRLIPRIVMSAERGGFDLADVSVSEPSLETVFINLTGKELRD